MAIMAKMKARVVTANPSMRAMKTIVMTATATSTMMAMTKTTKMRLFS